MTIKERLDSGVEKDCPTQLSKGEAQVMRASNLRASLLRKPLSELVNGRSSS